MRNGNSPHRSKPRAETDGYEDKIERVPESGCWLWTGAIIKSGYGRVTRNNRQVLVHRLLYERKHGLIPNGLFACHRCDVRCCVNPAHIFIGDGKANLSDAARKGSFSRRPANNFKLLAADVRAIRGSTEGTMRLARHYGVTKQTITKVRKGRSWTKTPLVERR